MKTIVISAATWCLSIVGQAHDEGHGPKLNDIGKHGGVVTAVVLASEKTLGPKAKLVYKSELIRMQDGTIKYYMYDLDMKALTLDGFEKRGQGIVEFTKKKQVSEMPFELDLKDGSFTGKAPIPSVKPFNVDIRVKQGGKEFLAAFDNLD